MSIPALIAGVVTLIACVAHAIVGGAELRYLVPRDGSEKAREVSLQVLGAWHWLSVELGLASIVFLLIGTTAIVPHEEVVLAVLAIHFAATGAAFLLAVLAGGARIRETLTRLPQWTFCFGIAVLAMLAR